MGLQASASGHLSRVAGCPVWPPERRSSAVCAHGLLRAARPDFDLYASRAIKWNGGIETRLFESREYLFEYIASIPAGRQVTSASGKRTRNASSVAEWLDSNSRATIPLSDMATMKSPRELIPPCKSE